MPQSDNAPPLAADSETAPKSLARPDGATIAYHRLAGRLPGIVFLGGFRSDMTGTKALYLEEYSVAASAPMCVSTISGTVRHRAISRWAQSGAGATMRLR